jgi:hypothetical protein
VTPVARVGDASAGFGKKVRAVMTAGTARTAAALVAVLGASAAGIGLAAAADLVPHEAFYTLQLNRTSPGSTLSDVKGAMYIDWVESCEGWSSSQRLQLRFYDSAKAAVEVDSRFASWESRDGLSYRFSVESTHDKTPDKQLNGKATLQGQGLAGQAEFIGRDPMKMELPAGTVFPVRHMIDLIDRAVAGDKIVSRTVFDGTSDEGPFEVNAVIGPLKKAVANDPIVPKAVNQAYRPMRLAFFKLGSDEMTPFYELSVNLMDNGIARSLLLDYGDSVIGAKLERIEILEKPKC